MRLYWGSCCSGKEPNKEHVPLLAHSGVGRAGSIYGVRFKVGSGWVQGSGPKGGLGGLPTPSVMLCITLGHASYLAVIPSSLCLFPAPQKWQLGFWPFSILLSIPCLNCTCTQLFLVPYYSFVFCCSRRCLSRCLSRCKCCCKGSQIPACLRMNT